MRRRGRCAKRAIAAAAITSCLTLGSPGTTPAAAQPAPTAQTAQTAQTAPIEGVDAGATYEVVVSAGKSQVIQLPTAYTDVLVADPKIADILPLNNRSVYVVGKAMGATALTIYGPGKRLLAAVNVVVSADVESFKSRLNDILPNEKGVAARPANQSIIISGVASSGPVLQQILTLAETYAPGKVVNMMSVEGVQQVMLSVRFVEMERTLAKGLRGNVSRDPTNTNPVFSLRTGDTLVNTTGAVLDSFGALATVFHAGDGDLTVLLDALETKGLVKTLAEPNLVAMSGDTANFLAGGEFPIPVASSASNLGAAPTITIAFKQFGVGLAFTPTVLSDGLINLVVNPEVSSIDPTTSVSTGIVTIPGLKVRRAHTTVELRDGESFTIAGLLKDNYQSQTRQFPFLGDIPVLGALFRSTGYQRDETELVIVVTPHLVVPRRGKVATPADQFIPASDLEMFLFGYNRGGAGFARPEDRALLATDPSKGGIDGPHGHVVY